MQKTHKNLNLNVITNLGIDFCCYMSVSVCDTVSLSLHGWVVLCSFPPPSITTNHMFKDQQASNFGNLSFKIVRPEFLSFLRSYFRYSVSYILQIAIAPALYHTHISEACISCLWRDMAPWSKCPFPFWPNRKWKTKAEVSRPDIAFTSPLSVLFALTTDNYFFPFVLGIMLLTFLTL